MCHSDGLCRSHTAWRSENVLNLSSSVHSVVVLHRLKHSEFHNFLAHLHMHLSIGVGQAALSDLRNMHHVVLEQGSWHWRQLKYEVLCHVFLSFREDNQSSLLNKLLQFKCTVDFPTINPLDRCCSDLTMSFLLNDILAKVEPTSFCCIATPINIGIAIAIY